MVADEGPEGPILLDCDGVLLDVSERYYRTHLALVGRLTRGDASPPVLDRATFWDMKRRRRPVREIVRASGLDAGLDLYYGAGWLERIESAPFVRYDRLLPGARESLERLAARAPLILVSLRQRPDLLRERVEALGLRPYFRSVLVGSPRDGEGWQTKAALIREALGTGRARLIAGDTEVDIRAGKALGIIAVGVLSGIRDRTALEAERPDYLVDDLGGLLDLPDLGGPDRAAHPSVIAQKGSPR